MLNSTQILLNSVRNAERLVLPTLIEENQRLSHFLESPFLPVVEKKSIWDQIQKNQRSIEKLEGLC